MPGFRPIQYIPALFPQINLPPYFFTPYYLLADQGLGGRQMILIDLREPDFRLY